MSQKHKISKRVSNYELFFDLSFVLAMGQLTGALHLERVGFVQVAAFVIINIIMMNIWYNETFYYNKYGDSRQSDVYTVIALMFIVGNITLTLTTDFSTLHAGSVGVLQFNGLLMLAYAIIALQYILKGRKYGFTQDVQTHILQLVIYILSLLPFVLGWLPVTLLTSLIYLVPLVTPFIFKNRLDNQLANFPHIVERLQLFIILTFGESVIAIIKTYPVFTQPWNGLLLFWGMASMFMFYMGQTFLNINHHQISSARLLFYAHIPIFLGINFFTVGLEFLSDNRHLTVGSYLVTASAILFLLRRAFNLPLQ